MATQLRLWRHFPDAGRPIHRPRHPGRMPRAAISADRKVGRQRWLFYAPTARPIHGGYCVDCHVSYRGTYGQHATTQTHWHATRPKIVRRSRLGMAIADGGTPSWIIGQHREDDVAPADWQPSPEWADLYTAEGIA